MENANLLREGGPENSKRIALGAEGGTFIVGVPRWLRMTGTPGCFFAIVATRHIVFVQNAFDHSQNRVLIVDNKNACEVAVALGNVLSEMWTPWRGPVQSRQTHNKARAFANC